MKLNVDELPNEIKNSTILHIATHFGCFELIAILLHNGLSATTLDGNEQTPLVLLALPELPGNWLIFMHTLHSLLNLKKFSEINFQS
jgi:hypothetical protein